MSQPQKDILLALHNAVVHANRRLVEQPQYGHINYREVDEETLINNYIAAEKEFSKFLSAI